MFSLISTILRVLRSGLQSRSQLLLENMALRHQLTVFSRSVPKPRLRNSDRLLWMLLQRYWSDWRRAPLIVQPRTVIVVGKNLMAQPEMRQWLCGSTEDR